VTPDRIKKVGSFPQLDVNSLFVTSPSDEIRISRLCRTSEEHWEPADFEFVRRKAAEYSENQYSEAKYTQSFFAIEPKTSAEVDKNSLPNTVKDIDSLWNPRKFSIPRRPFVIGRVVNTDGYSQPGTVRCLHLPIKLPASEIRVPREYLQFQETLDKIFTFEASVNSNFPEYFAYLTVDQRFVPKGASQRLPGAHVDGIPRDRDNPHLQKIDHSYLVTDNLGTRFFEHEFQLDHYDLKKTNFFAAMRLLADEQRSVVTKPYEITLMNAYSVHSAIPSDRSFYRTFLRVEFSVLRFDRLGNAINPWFDYKWEYSPSRFPADLVIPDDIS